MSNSDYEGLNNELENECLTIEKLQIDSETDSSLDDSIEEDEASVASTSQAVEVALPDEKLKKQNKNVRNKTKSKGKLKRNNQADGPHEYKLFVTKLTQEVTSENIQDYFERYAISPPEECRRHGINNLGGSYHEEGCAEKFQIWLKAWAGCTGFVVMLVFFVEVKVLKLLIL